MDPPYDSSNDYDNYISPEQMYDEVKKIKGRFLLSYNDNPNIRKIFKEYNIYKIETNYSPTKYIKQYRVIKELAITNYIV